MQDVADLVGVSQQTVSRVLNDFPSVKQTTRARVLAAIDELGYRRNYAARSLATGRTHSIGVLVPETPNFGPTWSLYAVERAAREVGYYPLVTTTPEEIGYVEAALDFLIGRAVEALVLMAPNAQILEAFDRLESDIPTVFLLTGDARKPWSASVDQAQGVRLAMDHLRSLGHRAIQHVSGPIESTEANLRSLAVGQYARDHGLPELPAVVGDWTANSGYDAFAQLDPTATAAFCANDQMAIGLVHAAVDSGRRVPSDLSVVGFDDIQEANHVLPPLTTIQQDFRGVGQRAVDILVAALEGGEPADDTPLAAELVVRSSTAPPRS